MIKNERGRLPDGDIERMVDEAEQYKQQDENSRARTESKNHFEPMLYGLKQQAETAPDPQKTEMMKVFTEYEQKLNSTPNGSKETYEQWEKELRDQTMKFIQSMPQSQMPTKQTSMSQQSQEPTIEEVD